MKFGICASCSDAPAMKAAGWDFVEENAQGFLHPQQPDSVWQGPHISRQSALPILAVNSMVPGLMKITGPDADVDKLADYFIIVARRAQQIGIETIVFGSGAARNVPDGFDRKRAREQIIEFGRTIAPLAMHHGITIVLEPLNSQECNIINSVPEAMEYVAGVRHPGFQCLVDSYHFWLENDSLEKLAINMPWIKHVHLADKDGRVAPGESMKSDYRSFFKVLKAGGYDGKISVECAGFNIPARGIQVLEFIKKMWNEA